MRDAPAALAQEERQSFQSISTSTQVPGGPRWNAMKHGLCAEAILLPGDDVAEFQRERRALFHNYRPQTKDEADLVEKMAEHLWVGLRYRPTQARFDGQAVAAAADAAGQICEPIGHQRLHSGMDVTVQRKRIDNMWHRARAQLVMVQKLRRQGLVAGALKLPINCYMETDGRVFGPVAQPVIVPIPEPEIETDKMDVSGSGDLGIGLFLERKKTGSEAAQVAGQVAEQAGIERGDAALPGAALLGTLLQSTGGKLPAPARPTPPKRGKSVLPGAAGERAVPRRGDSRRRLIGGFGARRIFLEHPRSAGTAEGVTQGGRKIQSRPRPSFSGAGGTPAATGSQKVGGSALRVPSRSTILFLTSPTPLPIVKNSAEMP